MDNAERKYIDIEEAIEYFRTHQGRQGYKYGDIAVCLKHDIPPADVKLVKRGKWIDEPIKGIQYHCSMCNGRFDYKWKYCPNCGCDMY